MTLVHGNPWTPGIWQTVIPAFYYAVAQTPIRALRIKHFRKAGRKMSTRKKQAGRSWQKQAVGSLQGYRCTESQY
jgi:hypothetical protein